jgi:N-acylneuraminate cytidylyltransferase
VTTAGGRVIGVIPARGGSLRLPGKNVRPLGGRPLIAWTIAAARAARSLDAVLVSTDDAGIADVAAAAGARVVARPADLARADSPIDDAMRHAAETVERDGGAPVDVVVCMQANVPVRKSGEIDDVVARLSASPSATAVATGYAVSQRPEWMKRIRDAATMEIEPHVDAGTSYRTQDLPELYLLDGAIVAVRAAVLRKTAGDRRVHAYMGDRVVLVAHHPKFAVEVDEEPDVDLAEFFLGRPD